MIPGPRNGRTDGDTRPLCVFVVAASQSLGMGHVYRATSLAAELEAVARIAFVCPIGGDLATEVLARVGHEVYAQEEDQSLAECVLALAPQVVINDILDTRADYVDALKAAGLAVVSFEDRGPGAMRSDLVFNALFMDEPPAGHFRYGPRYFCLRDEFLHTSPDRVARHEDRVLVSFGGVDSADSTGRVVSMLTGHGDFSHLHVTVITGLGYLHRQRLMGLLSRGRTGAEVAWTQVTHRMATHMAESSFAVTSAGRTVFELAAMRLPGIVMAANRKEEEHRFARLAGGFLYLGRNDTVSDEDLFGALNRMSRDAALRGEMRKHLTSWDLGGGSGRVVSEIRQVITGTRGRS